MNVRPFVLGAFVLFSSCPTPAQGSGSTNPKSPTNAQGEDDKAKSAQSQNKAQVVVTATRLPQRPLDVPYSAELLSSRELRARAYRTVPQSLRDVPGVMVQETAHGHGSPYIRGFTSFRTLFLIDGIRLNNSVFRPGPNQYWNTVDGLSLERIEIVKGPSSVLYGSDAIGGTVQAFSRNPFVYDDEPGLVYGGQTYMRYSSAENSVQARAELSFGYTHEDGSRTGLFVAGGAKHFGDLEGGDSVGSQTNTGYDETDFDLKLEHFFDEDTRLVFAHQRVDQDDVPRTHRTVHGLTWRGLSSGSDLQRMFDQRRYLSYAQFEKNKMDGFADRVTANLSWHTQNEVRNRVRGNTNREQQGFDVGTLGAWVQFESSTDIGELSYGVEYYRDEVDSFFRREVNPQPRDSIQGPVGDDANYELLGIYLQDRVAVSERFELLLGARFTYAAFDANSVRDPSTNLQIALDDDWSSFVGNVRGSYAIVPDEVIAYAGVSQGFRAPNLSDVTRFGTARSGEFEIPAPGLDPEEYISYEIGLKAEQEDVSLQTSWFYTDISDQILRFPTGNTNAQGDREVTKANIGDGYIQGIEFGAAWRFAPQWTAFGNATWMYGRLTNFDSGGTTVQRTYPTRMMPPTAQLGLRWDDAEERFWCEGVVVRAEDADKLSFGDQRDTSRIPPGGTPSFTVAHLRGGWRVSDKTSVDLLIENITDVDYRIHGSGQNRPGRNVIFGLTTRF